MTRAKLAQRIEEAWSLDEAAHAIEFEGSWLSWGELRDTARAIDRRLTVAGIGLGALITPAIIDALVRTRSRAAV